MIKSFPKVFAIGTDYIRDLFQGEVEITEKVDGSQFCFGKDPDGNFYMRSKGKQMFPEAPDKMFSNGIDYVLSIQDKIPSDYIFYCEYLMKEKHNALKYNRIPKNHLMLFGVSDYTGSKFYNYQVIEHFAKGFDIDPAFLLFLGSRTGVDTLLDLLERESFLGGPKIEGFVVKNYEQPFLLGGQPIPLMAGKFVGEAFKEVHRQNWDGTQSKGKWELFKESYRTEARWEKAIQHYVEKGLLLNDPKDIGPLIKEIQKDIEEEEKEIIKEFLWKEFGKEVIRKSTAGLPEWYKERLLKRSFE